VFCVVHAEETGEYCAFEHFNASCRSATKRIYIRSAQYGRMRVGRCVKVDLGYLGCAADVRHVIEARCSGRPRCSIAVADVELRTRSPCPTDVTWYLQVSYACVTGESHAKRRYRCVQKKTPTHIYFDIAHGVEISNLQLYHDVSQKRCQLAPKLL